MMWPWQVTYPHLRTKSNSPSDLGDSEHVTCECVICSSLLQNSNRLQRVLLIGFTSHSSEGTIPLDCLVCYLRGPLRFEGIGAEVSDVITWPCLVGSSKAEIPGHPGVSRDKHILTTCC